MCLGETLCILSGVCPTTLPVLVRRPVVPVLNKLLQLPLHPLAGAWRVDMGCTVSRIRQVAARACVTGLEASVQTGDIILFSLSLIHI